MRMETRIALGIGAVGVGGYIVYRLYQNRKASQTVQAAGLVAEGLMRAPPITVTPHPLLVSPDPLLTDIPLATWTPRDMVVYAFRNFLDAYRRYATHRLPHDLVAMHSYTIRVQGTDFEKLTREDLWTSEELRRLASQYTWEYVPQPRDTEHRRGGSSGVPRHILRVNGETAPVPLYAVSRNALVRQIMLNLLFDARAGRLLPPRVVPALMLPWYTKASSRLLSRHVSRRWYGHERHTDTIEWTNYWQGRGLQVVRSGSFDYQYSPYRAPYLQKRVAGYFFSVR